MKKYFCWSILCKAALVILVLSVAVALINLTAFDGTIFRIGFPSTIVTLHLDKAASPAVHVSLSGLTLDLLLAYAVCLVIDRKKQPK